jgi:hypothetical protein
MCRSPLTTAQRRQLRAFLACCQLARETLTAYDEDPPVPPDEPCNFCKELGVVGRCFCNQQPLEVADALDASVFFADFFAGAFRVTPDRKLTDRLREVAPSAAGKHCHDRQAHLAVLLMELAADAATEFYRSLSDHSEAISTAINAIRCMAASLESDTRLVIDRKHFVATQTVVREYLDGSLARTPEAEAPEGILVAAAAAS